MKKLILTSDHPLSLFEIEQLIETSRRIMSPETNMLFLGSGIHYDIVDFGSKIGCEYCGTVNDDTISNCIACNAPLSILSIKQ